MPLAQSSSLAMLRAQSYTVLVCLFAPHLCFISTNHVFTDTKLCFLSTNIIAMQSQAQTSLKQPSPALLQPPTRSSSGVGRTMGRNQKFKRALRGVMHSTTSKYGWSTAAASGTLAWDVSDSDGSTSHLQRQEAMPLMQLHSYCISEVQQDQTGQYCCAIA